MVTPLLLSCSDHFRVRFSKLLSDKFKKMDYKLAMRLTLTLFLFHANLLLAENIAAVAARTRSWFLQAWVASYSFFYLWKYRANILNRWQNYRKYVSFITIFPPEEFSAEMEMVARGLEKLMKLEERQSLMRTFVGIPQQRLEERVLGPHNVSVNEDLREAAKQVEVLASVQTYVLVFVTMYGRINHSHSIEFHPELLEQFAIGGKEADALEKSKISSSGGSSLHQYRDYQIF
ncbi:hypothetical protein HID58_036710 [Brassica napus]|uniref:Sucrose synthase n=1 Tax=Brassica napus TaxID=3708 RepID=A0ABQ8C8J8_BRANA|nr:hypothetical protein HID58_036710 [Brassica napus]